jgi:hypothetical protein
MNNEVEMIMKDPITEQQNINGLSNSFSKDDKSEIIPCKPGISLS